STGEFFVSALPMDNIPGSIRSEIARYRPAECIVPSTVNEDLRALLRRDGVVVTPYNDDCFRTDRAGRTLCDHFGVATLAGYGCDAMPCAIGAAGAALSYAEETQKSALPHVSSLSTRSSAQGMMLDAITLRNLEVHESIRGGTKGTTLFSILDRTKTPMGSRLLLRQLTRPLTAIARIGARLDAVEYFTTSATLRMSLREQLSRHADIERITARIAYGNAGPRDLVALADSLSTIPAIKECLAAPPAAGPDTAAIPELVAASRDMLCDLPDVIDLVRKAITDDPPAIAKNGGVIRPGYSAELDEMTGILHSGKNWIVELQQQ